MECNHIVIREIVCFDCVRLDLYRPYFCISHLTDVKKMSAQNRNIVIANIPYILSIIQWTDLTGLEPTRNAVEMESVLNENMSVYLFNLEGLIRLLTLHWPHATVHSSVVALP
jgi:hypothetical protein